MNFKKLKSQSGRSMVEMLGVLAIIGVLSVGGIAGYTLAMRRHRANGVADVVSKYALVVYGQYQQKVIDGEISPASDTNSFFDQSSISTFEEAGIGSFPAGVSNIKFMSVELTKGVDTVHIATSFSDKKLCQAVASIAGTGCGSNVIFKIPQN